MLSKLIVPKTGSKSYSPTLPQCCPRKAKYQHMPRRNISWRLCRETGETALSSEQIQLLALKFKLNPDDLTQLSASLAWALDPYNRPRSVIHAMTAKKDGALTLKEAIRDISKASALLEGTRIQLRSLGMSTPVGEDKYVSPFQHLFRKLIHASVDASVVSEFFEEAAKAGMTTYQREPRDKRLIRDDRRGMVCGAIIRFWDRVGRRVGYSTDPSRNERKGPLIDFINAVVALVTEPSTQLSGETISAEITGMKHLLAVERRLDAL